MSKWNRIWTWQYTWRSSRIPQAGHRSVLWIWEKLFARSCLLRTWMCSHGGFNLRREVVVAWKCLYGQSPQILQGEEKQLVEQKEITTYCLFSEGCQATYDMCTIIILSKTCFHHFLKTFICLEISPHSITTECKCGEIKSLLDLFPSEILSSFYLRRCTSLCSIG